MHSSHPRRALATVVLAVVLGACAATPIAFDPAAESAALMKRDAEWADLATAGTDVEKIISYWSDDAVVMEPGQHPVEGKAAIRAYVTSMVKTPGFKIHWVSQKPTFSP